MVRITETEDEDVSKGLSVASSPRTPKCRAIDRKRDLQRQRTPDNAVVSSYIWSRSGPILLAREERQHNALSSQQATEKVRGLGDCTIVHVIRVFSTDLHV